MTFPLVLLCFFFAGALAVGQILLKAASTEVAARIAKLPLIPALLSPRLIIALAFYGALSALWVFILTKLPLNRAYPFSLLGAALVPPLAYWVFGESIDIRYLLGMGLILAGLLVMYVRT